MIIFVDQISERLIYIKEYIFDAHGISGEFTNDKNRFAEYIGEKLIYSDWPIDGFPKLIPTDLLFDEKLGHKWTIELSDWNETPCLIFDGIIDPLASIFYVLSRYEEYGTILKDEHERFTAKMSLQNKFNLLKRQIVEEWIETFVRVYSPKQLEKLKAARETVFIPTIDIDNTFAFKWKEGWRSWLSNAKDFLNNKPNRRQFRKEVLAEIQVDPYDCYEYLENIAKRFSNTRFFWLLGDFAKHDKNISASDPRHQVLIRKFGQIAHVGLHPSYASNLEIRKLVDEKEKLEAILSRKVTESRQHFLKLSFPQTYAANRKLGFERDFTMGFADEVGFRAGTAHTHFYFDLTNNSRTNYEIVPFVYMDGTLLEYKKFSLEEAQLCLDQLVNEVKKYGGVFSCIWHNESLAEAGIWKNWKQVFEHNLTYFE